MREIQIRSTDYRAYPIVYKSRVIKDKERMKKSLRKIYLSLS